MADNITTLGLDISSFGPEKEATLNRFIQLFGILDKYDGKVYNPIMGEGLVAFNNSVQETNKLLFDMNSRISTLNTSTRSTSVSTKQLTAEEAAQKVQLQETNKQLIEQAKQQNSLVQARLNSRKVLKAQFDAETAEAKQREADSKLIAAMQRKQSEDSVAAAKSLEKAKKQQEDATQSNIRASQKEDQANKVLLNDYALLKLALQDQAVSYSNLYINKGKNAPETKEALNNFQQTALVINDIDRNLNKAGGSAGGVGRALGGALNQLRNIAYILPGIGLAGIFNLMFTALENCVEELGLFINKEQETSKVNTELNNSLSGQISLWNELIRLRKEFSQSFSEGVTVKKFQDELDVSTSKGLSQNLILQKEIENSKRREKDATTRLTFGEKPGAFTDFFFKGLKDKADAQLSIVADLHEKIQKVDDEYRRLETTNQGKNTVAKEKIEELKKLRLSELNSELDVAKVTYKETYDKLTEYYDSKKQLAAKQAEYDKLLADQERNRLFQTTKADVDLNIDKNEKILNSDISSEITRDRALRSIRDERLRANKAELQNVLTNRTSTPDEILIAEKKFAVDNLKAQAETNEQLLKLHEDYRQRRIKAITEINKDEVEKEAIKNEKIFGNVEQDLDNRIKAYGTYIHKKQVLQDLEYAKDIDVLRLKARDKSGKLDPTVQLEIEELQKARDTQKINIQADAEKQVYDIVFTSLQKELKAIVDKNEIESYVDKEAHVKALEELNDHYAKKKISYIKYKEEQSKIEKQFSRSDLDQEILHDEESLLRLQIQLDKEKEIRKKAQEELENERVNLQFQKDQGGDVLGAQGAYDKAKGQLKGAEDAVNDAEKKAKTAAQKLTDDKLKKAKIGLDGDDAKNTKKWAEAIKEIENALYKSIKSLADAGYEYRVTVLERQKALVDEQYGYEISAIEKSSLSIKDKAALEIQLQEQKREFDKNTAVEERRIKREEAEFDKKLAIAHIIFGTAAAVIAAGAVTPKAVAAGVVGGIELITAIATPIPSYKRGVKSHQGGKARYGEDGMEIVKEPYKSPYLVVTETISYLPKGTEVIPVKESPVFREKVQPDGWEQTIWLAKQIKKSNQKTENRIKVVVNNDIGFETYRLEKLYGKK